VRVFAILLALASIYFLSACRETEAAQNFVKPKLSWEIDSSRSSWSEFVAKEIEKSMPSLEKAKDILDFCPKYASLDAKQKPWVWAELISAMAKFESGWSPTARMVEPSSAFPSKDPVTGQPKGSCNSLIRTRNTSCRRADSIGPWTSLWARKILAKRS
jgi:hypothetical protein